MHPKFLINITLILCLCGKWVEADRGNTEHDNTQQLEQWRSVFATVAQKARYAQLYLNAIEYGRIKPWNIQLKQNQPFHLLIKTLLLLSGDIESNPGPATNSCGICHKLVKRNDKAIQCDDCDRWIHARCTGIDKNTYIKLQKSDDKWHCSNCIAPCGLCSGSVHNYNRAIECDKYKAWIHTSCATVSDDDYKVIQATNCTWICPTCDTANLSTFSSSSSGIATSNP